MAMWAQTFQNGHAYYREHRGSRGAGACVNGTGSVRAEVVDEQVGALMEGLVLPEDWLAQALERISLHDEVARVEQGRAELKGKLQRLGRAFVDGLVQDLPTLWRSATTEERHRLLGTVLEAVYVDAQAGRVVRVQAKGAFEAVLSPIMSTAS
jgi:hypothetical protein